MKNAHSTLMDLSNVRGSPPTPNPILNMYPSHSFALLLLIHPFVFVLLVCVCVGGGVIVEWLLTNHWCCLMKMCCYHGVLSLPQRLKIRHCFSSFPVLVCSCVPSLKRQHMPCVYRCVRCACINCSIQPFWLFLKWECLLVWKPIKMYHNVG